MGSLASMAASTMFFWLRVSSVHEKYKSALVISGLVTFIAAYHYVRIFNSWTESYAFPADGGNPTLTGKPFNDAYRYMDWLLTVPLLLLELIVEGDLTIRFMCFFFSFMVFLYIVYKLLVGLQGAIQKETNPEVAAMLNQVCLATVVSWCTYPVVYLLPFMGVGGAKAVVGIQLGYCASDVISKCGVGFLIYNITMKKSEALKKNAIY